MKLRTLMAGVALASSLAFTTEARELNLYSVYGGDRLDAILRPFTELTGIQVNVVTDDGQVLMDRISDQGQNSDADLFLDKDLVFLGQARDRGILKPFSSEYIENVVPAPLKDTERYFTALFFRARTILYNANVVDPKELSTYRDLGSEKWRGRLCVRVAGSSYNQALVAFLIEHYGREEALKITKSWMDNLAIAPTSNDRAMIAAVAEGTCDVALVNTYYLAPFIEQDPDFPVRVFFANQGEESKTHINGVGIGIVKTSQNVKEATMLMEYLLNERVQAPIAAAFGQYPANSRAQISSTLVDFGPFEMDQTDMGKISRLVPMAKSVMQEAGWN